MLDGNGTCVDAMRDGCVVDGISHDVCIVLNPTTLKYLCTNHGTQRLLFKFEIVINVSVSSFRFI